MEAVVKLGGSLAETPDALKTLGVELRRLAKKHSFLVVPGGGRFADAVREYDKRLSLEPAGSHWLAILAMDLYGQLLTRVIPESRACTSLDEAEHFSRKGQVTILLPSILMSENDPFEPSWDVTSDAIAACIATRLQAKKLVLITDVDGIFTQDPKLQPNARLLRQVRAEELLLRPERTSVDRALPRVLLHSKLSCCVVNGRYPKRIGAVLSGQQVVCTRIVPT
ncbi:MAG: hypothetical protein ACE14S_02040 [Candidatus Bathyarchaeia archaeon]